MPCPGEDWANLARLTRERRAQLGLNQIDVDAAGGPSTAVVRRIENEQAPKYQPKTFRMLETALRLRPGSVRSALDGGPFYPLERDGPAPPRPGRPRFADPALQRVYDAAEGLPESDRLNLVALAEAMRARQKDA